MGNVLIPTYRLGVGDRAIREFLKYVVEMCILVQFWPTKDDSFSCCSITVRCHGDKRVTWLLR